jgi:hypothetical protein
MRPFGSGLGLGHGVARALPLAAAGPVLVPAPNSRFCDLQKLAVCSSPDVLCALECSLRCALVVAAVLLAAALYSQPKPKKEHTAGTAPRTNTLEALATSTLLQEVLSEAYVICGVCVVDKHTRESQLRDLG